MSDTKFLSRFMQGFKKTSQQIASIFTGNKIDDETWELLEERLILSDIGISLVDELITKVKKNKDALKNPEELLKALRIAAVEIFPEFDNTKPSVKPWVTLVIGVNGAGKTTTIAKLSKRYKENGDKLLLCAADTFRAAAIDQLKSWADKLGIDIIAPPEQSDPASVAFDGVTAGVNKKYDKVIVDTAGRLHTKHNLMEELKKINRVTGKACEGAPHEVLLVLDGTAGQNALSQAKVFNEAIPVTALAITKLDGTAKGGIVFNIANELKIPVKYIGLGEKPEDLMDFDPEAYVNAIFSL